MKKSALNPLTLTIPFWSSAISEAIDLGLAFKTHALKYGGDGRVYRDVLRIRVELEGLENSRVQELVDSALAAKSAKKVDISITYAERSTELSTAPSFGEILSQRMTKKVLMALPSGAWIVHRDHHWMENLEPGSDRHLLWKKIVALKPNDRHIDIVWCQEDAESRFRSLRTKPSSPSKPSMNRYRK